jgi:hypothetical protein
MKGDFGDHVLLLLVYLSKMSDLCYVWELSFRRKKRGKKDLGRGKLLFASFKKEFCYNTPIHSHEGVC